MNTQQVINYISTHPEFTNIVIKGSNDLEPMQAIECLRCENFDNDWAVNSILIKNTLLVYNIFAPKNTK